MLYARIVLALVGLFYVVFGALGIANPAAATGMTEISLPTPTAVTDGRAIYGGLSVGLGLFLLAAAARYVSPRSGLLLLALANGLPVLCRIYGILWAGAATRGTYQAIVPELVILAMALVGLWLQ